MKKGIFFLLITLIVHFGYSQTSDVKYQWISAKSGLRMRDAPNLDGTKMSVIPYGERIEILEELDDTVYLANTFGVWKKVIWKESNGWVYGGFLSDIHPSEIYRWRSIPFASKLREYHKTRFNSELSLCRVELSGSSVLISEKGIPKEGYISETYYSKTNFIFENGIMVVVNRGYESESNNVLTIKEYFSFNESLDLASTIYSEKYAEYLNKKDGKIVLPTSSGTIDGKIEFTTMETLIENGDFKYFRIYEGDGCVNWWTFEVNIEGVEFGSGGGC